MHSLLSALCTSLLLVTTVANAADNAMLAERHAKRGVACTSCHVKSPNDKPTMTQCLACHGGSFEANAANTEKYGQWNPHSSIHGGYNSCDNCHEKGQEVTRNWCANCHTYSAEGSDYHEDSLFL